MGLHEIAKNSKSSIDTAEAIQQLCKELPEHTQVFVSDCTPTKVMAFNICVLNSRIKAMGSDSVTVINMRAAYHDLPSTRSVCKNSHILVDEGAETCAKWLVNETFLPNVEATHSDDSESEDDENSSDVGVMCIVKHKVGLFIGTDGSTIKRLQDQTNKIVFREGTGESTCALIIGKQRK